MRQVLITVLALVQAGVAYGQESQLGAEFRHEGDAFRACGNIKKAIDCGQTLFTGHPLHIAVGSLAPGNGTGFGGAFVSHWTPGESWRLNYDMDGVVTPNGSWRAGGYLTGVFTGNRPNIVAVPGGPGVSSDIRVKEQPVFHAYVQGISLGKLAYFGIGPDTKESGRSYFAMQQTVTGGNIVWPVLGGLNLSLFGEANGRFVDLRPSLGQESPTIGQLYTEATAPGLTNQNAFAQFGEGIRVRPRLAGGFIRLNYFAVYQQFVSPGDSRFSFNRFTMDLQHQFPLYRRTRDLIPRDANGPNDCSLGPPAHDCPPVMQGGGVSRNLEGSFNIRILMNNSFTSAGHVVPFYFQPTLGGSDLNGLGTLGSFRDYRFRAPNSLLFRASFEHSLFNLPLGVAAQIDEGKVAMEPGDLGGWSGFRHSYGAGLTLRAGGMPQVYLMFFWGGGEGRHTTFNTGSSLIGGAMRPSLY